MFIKLIHITLSIVTQFDLVSSYQSMTPNDYAVSTQAANTDDVHLESSPAAAFSSCFKEELFLSVNQRAQCKCAPCERAVR